MKSLFSFAGYYSLFAGGFYCGRQIRQMYIKGGAEFSSLKTRHDGCGNC